MIKLPASFTKFKFPVQNSYLPSLIEQYQSISEIKQIHAHIITTGLMDDTIAVSKLVAFCSLSAAGDLLYARKVFDSLPHRNRFMYNTLIRGYSKAGQVPIEALVLHRSMIRGGLLPNGFTLPFVLKSCAFETAFIEAQLIHALTFKLGFSAHVFVMNSLLHAYIECGHVTFWRKVFDEIPCRSLVSWNSLIRGYSQLGDCGYAFSAFRRMTDLGLKPDEFTLTTLLSICSQTGNLNLGRCLHGYIETSGSSNDLIVANALLDMYGKCGDLGLAQICFDKMRVKNVLSWTSLVCAHARHGHVDVARFLFSQMSGKNIASWNAMISSYIHQGLCQEGLTLYNKMQDSGVIPDEVTLTIVLSACSQIGDLVVGKRTHDYICKNLTNPSVLLMNSLVDMYAKCGPINIALDIFNLMQRKDIVSWNSMIAGLAIHGRASAAVELFESMVCQGFLPDGFTFTGLLSACSHGGLLEIGEFYFKSMNLIYRVPYEIEHYACMVDLLGRKGKLRKAVELIYRMPMKPDVVVWSALLAACRNHGSLEIANQALKQLMELETNSGGLYVLVSNLYYENRMSLVARNLWKLMKSKRIKKDQASSLIEVDGEMFEFVVEDKRHESSSRIYSVLDQLKDHLISQGLSSENYAIDLQIHELNYRERTKLLL